LHYPLRVVLFFLAEGTAWGWVWYPVGGAAAGAAVVAVTLLTAVRATKPQTQRWSAAAVLAGVIASAAVVIVELPSLDAFIDNRLPLAGLVTYPMLFWMAIWWAPVGSLVLRWPFPVWRFGLASAGGIACGMGFTVIGGLLSMGPSGTLYIQLFGLPVIMMATAACCVMASLWRRREHPLQGPNKAGA
jgi:hypothetical protein